VTADDTTSRYLKSWETTPKMVRAALRAWGEHLDRERTVEAKPKPKAGDDAEPEPDQVEDEEEALFDLLRRRG